jgi:hypothetical protein
MGTKKLIGIILGLSFLIIITLSLLLTLPKKASFFCTAFEGRYPQSDCGYLASTQDQKTVDVIGVVRKLYQKNSVYLFDMDTKDAKGDKTTTTIAFPPNSVQVAVTALTPADQISMNPNADPTTLYTPQEAFQKLTVGEQIIVRLISPDSTELAQYKVKFGTQSFVKCLPFNTQFINALRKPSLSRGLQLRLKHVQTSCNVITFQIITQS